MKYHQQLINIETWIYRVRARNWIVKYDAGFSSVCTSKKQTTTREEEEEEELIGRHLEKCVLYSVCVLCILSLSLFIRYSSTLLRILHTRVYVRRVYCYAIHRRVADTE